jgi:hypothetical protein
MQATSFKISGKSTLQPLYNFDIRLFNFDPAPGLLLKQYRDKIKHGSNLF